jgi:biopolymer transport protein ExbB/TolQ
MLVQRLFNFFVYVGSEWVLWLMLALSVISVALTIERILFFVRNSSTRIEELMPLLVAGKLAEAKALLAGATSMEAAVMRAAIDAAPGGPASVEEVIAGEIMREREPYERGLSFLGTLGNNAPFIGLFGTVIGIIKAFADLALGGAAGVAKGGASAVMAGISEALVATAVGIFIAIPAVVAFNGFTRWLKVSQARTQALGHALVAHLKKDEPKKG